MDGNTTQSQNEAAAITQQLQPSALIPNTNLMNGEKDRVRLGQ